jgi:hypothetical protein
VATDREACAAAIARMREAERDKLRRDIMDLARTEVRNGVRYWRESGNIIPPYVFNDAEVICPAVQSRAYERHLAQFMADYRRQRPMSWDNRAEMENELGPGAVDIFTGERF